MPIWDWLVSIWAIARLNSHLKYLPRTCAGFLGESNIFLRKQKKNIVMIVSVKGNKVNITPELQSLLRDNPPVTVKKPVIMRRKTKDNDFVDIQDVDDNGVGKTIDATYLNYPYIYFDASGRYYLNVFRTTFVDYEGKKVEVIVTNPNIKTEPDCTLYAKGEKSHSVPIQGSENWADGRPDNFVHYEAISKGVPEYKIVFKLTRQEVLDVELKPQGESLIAKVANATDAEKKVIIEHLFGKDFAAKMQSTEEE